MFNIKISEINESQNPSSGTFLQNPFWCQFKARHGWKYSRYQVSLELPALENDNNCSHSDKKENFTKTFELALLNRSFAKGIFNLAYIPLMPELLFECTPEEVINQALEEDGESFSQINQELITPETQTIEFANMLSELSKALKNFLPKNTIFIRWDPNVILNSPEDRQMFNFGMKTVIYADKLKLKKSRVDIQPPDSSLVDLTADQEEILNRMHQKWRYNIRLASRKGVEIKKYTGDSPEIQEKIDKFYELTKITNARDGNSSHAKAYYLDLIQSSAKERKENKESPLVSLYLAQVEGEEIAAIMTLFNKTEAIYLYGASSNEKRNLMPNHLLQWTAMQDAKEYGCKYYDMYGMPPEGKDQHHPMHGLYLFKTNFGGKNIHRTGSWDYPVKSIFYGLYIFAENLRAFYYKVLKKI
ncbi:MAG: peptidoglycan bridge formation glycyltransferase FemA/FemB family protein [Treponema sp.]|nr:peptidoglycan bridge formation glycyltransferase FemA/FemB family protein [Treponema sp.]